MGYFYLHRIAFFIKFFIWNLDICKIGILYLNKLKLKAFNLYKFLKKNNQQIIRFFVSGVIASIFNFISYRALYLILKNILFASIFGYFIGILVSFVFAKLWVFKNSSSPPLIKSFLLDLLIWRNRNVDSNCISQ